MHRAEHVPLTYYKLIRETGRRYAEIEERYRETVRVARRRARTQPVELKPLSFDDRSGDPLRPALLSQMVGQRRLRLLLARIVDNCEATGRPLEHMLLSGQAGTGKTTLGQVIAHELDATVYQTKAPVTHEILAAAQRQLSDGDVLIVDEIHKQVTGDRRGITQAADPEDFYHAMEDRRLPVQGDMLPFPAVTFIACTTDEGLLPEAFLSRFTLRLTLDPYTYAEMGLLANASAQRLGVAIEPEAAAMLGRASRRNPRQLNTYVRNAQSLGYTSITRDAAREVIVDLNGNTLDGLTPDMQAMLKVLLRSRRENARGEVVHQASVGTITTALGRSRDNKHVQLYVEPHLIAEGLVVVTHGGRSLTPKGITRALELARA
jgi:Holliday junction resolvasome RuvABC ATP-dependent DNA helicase subunit